jgi:hypothetical protein
MSVVKDLYIRPRAALTSGTRSIQDQLCLSAECVKAAAAILETLDESVDPCEDFYSFVSEWDISLVLYTLVAQPRIVDLTIFVVLSSCRRRLVEGASGPSRQGFVWNF